MIISTLSELPGKQCEPLGLVSTIYRIHAGMRSNNTLDVPRDQLIAQAAAMHADAVIDVQMQSHLEPRDNHPAEIVVILLGTAVHFL